MVADGRMPGMSEAELPEHVRRNRAVWDEWAPEYEGPGHRSWAAAEPSWGVWGVPEANLHVLPDVTGLDTIELGCGTAYVSAWLARRWHDPAFPQAFPWFGEARYWERHVAELEEQVSALALEDY